MAAGIPCEVCGSEPWRPALVPAITDRNQLSIDVARYRQALRTIEIMSPDVSAKCEAHAALGVGDLPQEGEQIAREFHKAYEALAPMFAYATRKASQKPWEQVAKANKRLMIATVNHLLTQRFIARGEMLGRSRDD